jgi:hypothetical protein
MEALKRVKHKGIKVQVVPNNPSSGRVLASSAARLLEAHAVVISGLHKKDDTSADAQVASMICQGCSGIRCQECVGYWSCC